MFVHENGTHSSRLTSWKNYPLLPFSPNLCPFQPVFFPTALTPVLSSLCDYYVIDKHGKLLSSLRFLWNLKMYIISLLVIYDAMISLVHFFFMLLLIYSFGLCSVWLSHPSGCTHYGAGGLGPQSVSLWCTGSVSPHVGSFQTRDRACAPCTDRQILNHWTTKEVPASFSIFF